MDKITRRQALTSGAAAGVATAAGVAAAASVAKAGNETLPDPTKDLKKRMSDTFFDAKPFINNAYGTRVVAGPVAYLAYAQSLNPSRMVDNPALSEAGYTNLRWDNIDVIRGSFDGITPKEDEMIFIYEDIKLSDDGKTLERLVHPYTQMRV